MAAATTTTITNNEPRSTDIKSSALELIGNTPLIALDRIWPGPGRILAKCEFLNPGGSIKDRSAYSMIKYAKQEGKLAEGAPIIEVTSGNQGCGIALVAALMNHPCTLTMSAGNSPQRAEMMRGFGANCELVPQVEGKPGNVTLRDVEKALERAEGIIAQTPNIFYVEQFSNPNNCRAHEETTGPEIYRQTGGRIDAFIATLGTAGSFVGISRYLKRQNPNIRCVIVEPEGAEVIAGKEVTKPLHLLQGSGYGKVPELFDYNVMDEAMSVTDEEALKYKNLLGVKEGLYVGFTSGANIASAVKLLESGKLGPDPWIVTLLNDSGLKYSELHK
ncbi:hypothetical protein RDWZM_000863 [Blomia tropicalis]|uniref:Tryptophan synthase beta chain-like PALP domain-containing protein n=1 Tax=Blomia tropicalis TaxID=40697 RepID=A0A9Q0M9P6_BLOTA|nr:hypothetical protein RDWZM_000863 [Blomia tropicalis]